MKLLHLFLFCAASAASFILSSQAQTSSRPTPGQPTAESVGFVTGRVLNNNGRYVSNARIRAEGGAAETYTDEFGRYSLSVPAGNVRLRVFYTGQPELTVDVAVAAGSTMQRDITLGGNEDVVQLDTFVTSAQRHMDGAVLAINEQRFSANIKNVVSSDAFADVGDGNLGEFAKYLPGVSVGNLGVDAVNISVRGMPVEMTTVSTDGNRIASANSSLMGRTFQLEQVSVNNVARIELIKTPTPDVPADTLGGSVNLISRRAFERAKPQFDWRVFVGTRDNLPRTLGKIAHSKGEPMRIIRPSLDFNWVVPLSDRLGFTLNGLHSNAPVRIQRQQTNWLPDHLGRLAGYTVPADNNPYLARFVINNGSKFTARSSIGATLDYKFNDRNEMSVGYQYNYYEATFNDHNIQYDVGRGVTAWGPDFVQGGNNTGSVFFGARQYGLKRGGTWMPTFNYRHRGDKWKANVSASYSKGTNSYRNIEKGFFENIIVRMRGPLTVRYDGVGPDGPSTITVTKGGQVTDQTELDNYYIDRTTGNQRQSEDIVTAFRADLQRTFDARIPIEVKAGIDVRRNTRDVTRNPAAWIFVGADGVANSADDGAGAFVDDGFSRIPPAYGHPPIEYPSYHKLYDLYVEHPEYFRANPAADHRTLVNFSQAIEETVSAAFVRVDARFLANRLWLVGGVRLERTEDSGEGAFVDNNAIYLRNASGGFVLDSSGNRIPITTDPLEQARLTHVERGTKAGHDYQDYYPSLNATYKVSDDLQVRAAYARTLGRPDYGNIIPGVTLPSGDGTNIIVQNPELSPWTADNLDVSAEYYFKSGGVFSAGLFHKEITDFFGSETTVATPQSLEALGLDPNLYDGFTITKGINVGDARVRGYEISYRQQLTFLPEWARGVELWANVTKLRVDGSQVNDFTGFTPTTVAYGGSLTRSQFTLHVNCLYTGRAPGSTLGGTQPPGTVNYSPPSRVADVNFEYRLTRRLGVFCNVRNVFGEEESGERYSPTTPAYARKMTGAYNARVVTMGIKGRF